MNQAESLLGPNDVYCDGVGMVVTRSRPFSAWWDTPMISKILREAETSRSKEIEEVFLQQPKVWILNWRTDLLKDVLGQYFAHSYVRIFPNVLVTGARVTSYGETRFINCWRGAYRMFSAEGCFLGESFFLNGQKVSGIVTVQLGENLLRLDGPSSNAYLLPADIAIPFEIPTNMQQMHLFADVYIK
jgi:hypothetical protein